MNKSLGMATGNIWLFLNFCIIFKFRIMEIFSFGVELSACLVLFHWFAFLHWMRLASAACRGDVTL